MTFDALKIQGAIWFNDLKIHTQLHQHDALPCYAFSSQTWLMCRCMCRCPHTSNKSVQHILTVDMKKKYAEIRGTCASCHLHTILYEGIILPLGIRGGQQGLPHDLTCWEQTVTGRLWWWQRITVYCSIKKSRWYEFYMIISWHHRVKWKDYLQRHHRKCRTRETDPGASVRKRNWHPNWTNWQRVEYLYCISHT